MKKKTSKKRTIAAISIAVVIILIATYFVIVIMGNAKSKDDDVLRREYPVTRGDITAGTDGSGSLVLDGNPQGFDLPVVIEDIYVKPGDLVKNGDKIAQASQKDIDEKLHGLQIELDKAKIALENAKNAKKAGTLDTGASGETSAVKAEYDLQKTQTQGEINAISANIAALESRISEIDTRITEIDAILPEQTDPIPIEEERAVLIEEKSAKEAELSSEKVKLSAANATAGQIESTEKQKLNDIARQDGIDQQKRSIEAADLTNGITLAQIDVDELNRKIEQAKQLLNNLVLTADRDGIVLDVNYDIGSETTEEKPVVTIGDSNEMYARLQVAQSDIVDIQEGQDVELTFDAFPEMTFDGVVTKKLAIPVKDSNPVMYMVNASVNKEDFELLSGMTCSATFIIKQAKDVLMLSNKAIKVVNGKQVVLLENENGELYEQQIETGFSDGKFSEVLTGLNEGQTVYVEG